MWITAAEVVGDAFFGASRSSPTRPSSPPRTTTRSATPVRPSSLATGQVLGGGIIWILGDAVGLPFLAVQLIQMMREDKVEAAAIDAELDARDAQREAARARQAARAKQSVAADLGPATAEPANASAQQPVAADLGPAFAEQLNDGAPPEYDTVTPATDDAGDDERPWWESDPRITNRYGRG